MLELILFSVVKLLDISQPLQLFLFRLHPKISVIGILIGRKSYCPGSPIVE